MAEPRFERNRIANTLGESDSTHGRDMVKSATKRLAPFLFLILISVVLSISSENFLTVRNILTILLQISVVGIIAVGQTMVMITAGIDLSVGGVAGLAGVVTTLLIAQFGVAIPPAIVAGIIVGILCGLVNGVLVTRINMPPFIATLGTMSVTRGLALVLTGGVAVYNLPEGFSWLGGGRLLGLPVPVVILVLVTVFMVVVLNKTVLGRHTFAIGSNREAAEMSGINVSRQLVKVYVICGGLSGLAGVILASRIVTGQPTAGLGYELDAIAACVIGGTSLFGGIGTITGSVVGAGLMGLIRNGSNLLNVSTFWQQISIGLIIWIAVAWDQYRLKHSS